MCGIAGIRDFSGGPVARADLGAMCAAMVHRGPDDEGLYLGAGVGLGMRRLSIIDLENGRQPMFNEDRSVWAVLNGEIYNYRELRKELASIGISALIAPEPRQSGCGSQLQRFCGLAPGNIDPLV